MPVCVCVCVKNNYVSECVLSLPVCFYYPKIILTWKNQRKYLWLLPVPYTCIYVSVFSFLTFCLLLCILHVSMLSERKVFLKNNTGSDNRLQVWWINFPTVQFFKIVCLHWSHVAKLLTITLAEFHSLLSKSIFVFL